jgi:inorganic pyrophosphatase
MAQKSPARRGRSTSLEGLAPFEDDCVLVGRSAKLSDLSQDLVAQIEHFFVSYNEMQGKRFEVKRRAGGKRARALVMAAMKRRR